MQVTIASKCAKGLNPWILQPYSPFLTNGEKLLINLSKLGQRDLDKWIRNSQIICESIDCDKTDEIKQITIENTFFYGQQLIVELSFDMNYRTPMQYRKYFCVDDTLNLYQEFTFPKKKAFATQLDLSAFYQNSLTQNTPESSQKLSPKMYRPSN